MLKICPTCRGHKMIQRVPSAQSRYPSLLVEKPEVSFVLCPTCKASSYIVYTLAGWKAAPRAVIRI